MHRADWVVPSPLREVLGFKPGDPLVVRVQDGRLVVESRESVVRRIQERFGLPGRNVVDELIADRRREARLEGRGVLSVVLDSSAVLALVHSEPGAGFVADALGDAVMSTVNWAEVVARVRGDATNGGDAGPSDLRFELCALGLRLEEFSAEQADLAGELRRSTREYGLSLGDRACLALALVRSEPVLTADRVWQRLSLDVDVEVIR